jgi:hypothetical protein
MKVDRLFLKDRIMKRLKSQLIPACILLYLLLATADAATEIDADAAATDIKTKVVTYPPNDLCTEATQLGDVTNLPFNTTGARFGGRGLCMVSPNIWYLYTAPCTGDVTVSLAGSGFDTMLAVYKATECFPTQNDFIACNDDFGGTFQSQVTFAATACEQYLIEVGGYGSEEGRGVITIRCEGDEPPASKDDCANARPIADVTDQAFDTTDAAFDGPGLCMVSPNIWFCYTATCTGEVTVSLLGSSYDTMLAAYRGCDCPPTSSDLIACNDDAGLTFQSEITFAAIAGEQYLIEVGGYDSETGAGLITIKCEGDEPPASKDDCASARPVGDVKDLPFDTTNTTFDGAGLCMRSPNIWFTYTASCTGDATVSLLGSAYDTMLAAYDGADCNPKTEDLIACNDDFGSSFQSQITFAAVAGNQYLIEVGGYASETGHGVLNIKCEGMVVQEKPDLGDAPDRTNSAGANMRAYGQPWVGARFPTVFDDGSGTGPFGPLHVNDQLVAYLGQTITAEGEADIGPDEDGVNNIDPERNRPNQDEGDDGVAMPLVLTDCGWSTIDYEVTVVKPNNGLWVNVWLDFNRDGDWDDTVDCPAGPAKEWAVQNQYLFGLPEGRTMVTSPAFLSVHPAGAREEIWMRITLAGQPWTGGSNPGQRGNGGSGPQSKYDIGETEDYFFTPEIVKDCPLCKDENEDGVIDINDLIVHITEWLATCQQ